VVLLLSFYTVQGISVQGGRSDDNGSMDRGIPVEIGRPAGVSISGFLFAEVIRFL